jgi:hypothetical protein
LLERTPTRLRAGNNKGGSRLAFANDNRERHPQDYSAEIRHLDIRRRRVTACRKDAAGMPACQQAF